jgi:hypothetical protein
MALMKKSVINGLEKTYWNNAEGAHEVSAHFYLHVKK